MLISHRARTQSQSSFRPALIADWVDAVFIHFALSPAELQPHVPFELDTRDGVAYVSLVAFTQSRLRPTMGGRLGEMLVAPLAHHEFFNVRTYVRHGDDRGIFFMAEWIPNRVAAFIGPRTYGLPYRLGRLKYHGMRREVAAAGRRLTLEASPCGTRPNPAFDEFLLEQYTAFTCHERVIRRFDVEHVPWPQRRRIDVDLIDTSLLTLSGEWLDHAQFAAAHHSPGVRDVVIGPARASCIASATTSRLKM